MALPPMPTLPGSTAPASTSSALSPNTMMAGAFAIQAVGSILAGQAQAQAYEARARLAAVNADIARQQGVAAAAAQHRDAERLMGKMIAGYGASGVQGDVGSPLDVLADSAAMATLDNLTIKYNYELKALGFQADSYMNMASAENARTSAILGAGAAGVSAYAMYANYNKAPGGTKIPGVDVTNGWAGTETLGSGTVQT